jgi:hypothetical protein
MSAATQPDMFELYERAIVDTATGPRIVRVISIDGDTARLVYEDVDDIPWPYPLALLKPYRR